MKNTPKITVVVKKKPVPEPAPLAPAVERHTKKTRKAKHADKPISKAERARRDTVKARAALDILRVTYPGAFDRHHHPLAIGIHNQLLAERAAGNLKMSTIPLRLALRHWTQSRPYVAQLVKGGPRFNLKGEHEGEVTEQQQIEAKTLLDRILSRMSNKEAHKAKKVAKLQRAAEQPKPAA